MKIRMDLSSQKVCFVSPVSSSQTLLPRFEVDGASLHALGVVARFSRSRPTFVSFHAYF